MLNSRRLYTFSLGSSNAEMNGHELVDEDHTVNVSHLTIMQLFRSVHSCVLLSLWRIARPLDEGALLN